MKTKTTFLPWIIFSLVSLFAIGGASSFGSEPRSPQPQAPTPTGAYGSGASNPAGSGVHPSADAKVPDDADNNSARQPANVSCPSK